MSKHLRANRRDKVLDQVHYALDNLRVWMYGLAKQTKTYLRETSKKQICIDFSAFLLLLFLVFISPVMLVVGIILW